MKGLMDINAVLYILVLIIITLFVFSIMSMKFFFIKNIEDEFNVKEDKYTMHHALESAKLYAQIALKYATEQACYDTLKDFDMEKDFETLLKDAINNYFNIYTGSGYNFLTEYHVTFPKYEIEISFKDDTTIINATSDENIKIEKTKAVKSYYTESSELELYPNITVSLNTNCKSLYTYSVSKKPEIEAEIKDIVNNVLKGFSTEYTSTSDNILDCNIVFEDNVGTGFDDAETRIANEITGNVSKINIAENGFETTCSVHNIDVNIEMLGKDIKDTGDKKTVTCKFGYNVVLDVKVITCSDTNVIVADNGKIDFHNLTISYHIKTNTI